MGTQEIKDLAAALRKSAAGRAKDGTARDSYGNPDHKEAENPQAHKFTPDKKGDVVGRGKCVHCGYGLRAHLDNGTGTVKGGKFQAYDSKEVQPV
jgi:hypothetical protein